MKEIIERLKLKTVLAIMLIFSLLISFFTPFVSIGAIDDDSSPVKFFINWANGTKELNTTSEKTVYAMFNLQLSGVPTGFHNLKIYAQDKNTSETTQLPTTSIVFKQTDQYTKVATNNYIEFSDVLNSGLSIDGTVEMYFDTLADGDKLVSYDRTIELIISGTYTDPQTGLVVNLEDEIAPIELNTHVEPTTKTTSFSTSLEFARSSTEAPASGTSKLWTRNRITEYYRVTLLSAEYTQTSTLDLTVNKIDKFGNNTLEDGYTINFGQLTTLYGEPQKIVNDDGSETYRFTKGEDADTFSEEDCYKINNTYTVTVSHIVAYPENEVAVTTSLNAKFDATGWKVIQNEDGISRTKTLLTQAKNQSQLLTVYNNTPGTHSWFKAYMGASGWLIESELIESLAEGEDIELKTSTYLDYTWGSDNSTETAQIYHNGGKITYIADDNTIKTLEITPDIMKLKSIKVSTIDQVNGYTGSDKLALYTTDGTKIWEGSANSTYTATSDVSLNNFYIELPNFLYNDYSGYVTTYTLSGEALKNAGLSENEIKNIIDISQYMSAGGSSYAFGYDSAIWETEALDSYKQSYMEATVTDLNTSIDQIGTKETKTLTISLNDNNNYPVEDVNPKFYIRLSNDFEFDDYDVSLTGGEGKIYIPTANLENGEKPYYETTIDGEKFLVINCIGTYDSETMDETKIIVNFSKKLINPSADLGQTMDVCMITDNEGYSVKTANTYNIVNNNGEAPAYIMEETLNFDISANSLIEVRSGIYNKSKRIQYYADSKEITKATKTNPMKFDDGQTIRYVSYIATIAQTLSNVKIISRLPIAGNTSITGTTYSLDSTISLTNLNNIKVYIVDKSTGVKMELDASKYTIGYSEDGTAGFGTTYTTYVEGTSDVSNAKTIMITLTNDLPKNMKVSVEYDMTMPEPATDNAIVGEVTAVSYTVNDETTVLEPAGAYVKNASSNGTVNIAKKFEGYELGTAPTGISLEGISFKLINQDTNEAVVVSGQTDSNGVFTTDSEGKVTVENVPEGTYVLEEVSDIAGFEAIPYTKVIIDNGEASQAEYVVENPRSLGTLNITKTWEDTNDQQGAVTFLVTRTSNDGITYSQTVTKSADESTVSLLGVPYGDYVITETEGVDKWTADPSSVAVSVDDSTVNATVANRIAKGTLKITKTVPDGDSVNGLTFDITGTGSVKYIDTEGNEKYLTVNKTVTVGEDYLADSDISVDVSEDGETAVITLSNLTVGIYTIEETGMPVLSDDSTERYVDVKRTAVISQEGQISEVAITNQWQTGSLKIVKTATDGIDLTQFSVRVTCDSTYYGTSYDKTFSFPEDGVLTIKDLYLGNYKVEEVESDYYNAYYTADNSNVRTIEAQTYEVKYNQMTTAQIYNETTSGYVKILKTLEGKDAEKAIGIKFVVSGYAPTGNYISTEVELTDTEEIDGVKYAVGVSTEIMAGGEYSLSEVKAPDYYDEADDVEVDITKHNNLENPLVVNIDNKRSKGTLDISTQTIPDGGLLSPIQYRVVEIEFTDDTNYEEVEGTEQILDAEADGTYVLSGINAGNYLVDLTKVPTGYSKDLPQLVEVPSNDIGYANFEIEQIEEMEDTTVTIQKEILNSNNQVATAEDFEAAKLDSNESFEVKLTNIDTKDEYYTFISTSDNGVIKGLGSGTYTIEEVYKLKYSTSSYLQKIGDVYQEMETVNGVYTFTISSESASNIEIKIQNKIDTSTGFGGQVSLDNLSKIDPDEDVSIVATRSVVYVTDEEGNALPGATFKLYNDSTGNQVVLGSTGILTTTSNKKVIIKGLPVGVYTLKCESVPDGYLKPADKQIVVYEDAVRVVRVEILTNVPRGNLTLSAMYTATTATGSTTERYTSYSKYKIYDTTTGEYLKFTKNLDGTYTVSKLATATDTVITKARSIMITGVSAGVTYKVGLVDVTNKYGVVNEEPATVTMVENETENVKIEVEERAKFVKVSTNSSYGAVYAVDSDNKLWYGAQGSGGYFGYWTDSAMICVSDIAGSIVEGIKIKDVIGNDNCLIILDTDGKVWTAGDLAGNNTTSSFTCISNLEGNPLNGIVIESLYSNTYTEEIVALDNTGKMWMWGEGISIGSSIYIGKSITPICINTSEYGLQDVKIVNLDIHDYTITVLDEDGKVWVIGYNYNGYLGINPEESEYVDTFTCLNDIPTNNLNGVKIVKVATGNRNTYFLDNTGKVWSCGNNGDYGKLGIGDISENYIYNPVCINDYEGNPLNGTKIIDINTNYTCVSAIDNNGKLWTWGYDYNNDLGIKSLDSSNIQESQSLPICITDLENNDLDTTKLVSAFGGSGTNVAIDEKGNLWMWGEHYLPVGAYISNGCTEPTKVTVARTFVFSTMDFIKVDYSCYNAVAVDTDGRIWYWGSNRGVGFEYTGTNQISGYPICLTENQEYAALNNVNIVDVGIANECAIALDSDGKVWTWGTNDSYPLGTGLTNTAKVLPTCISNLESNPLYGKTITSISVGYNKSVVAIDSDGKIWTWGNSTNIPSCVNDLYENMSDVKFAQVQQSNYYSDGVVALDTNGKVWTWGGNLGDGTTNTSTTPICISDIESSTLSGVKVISISKGGITSMALDENGNVWIWGDNYQGQLGNGTVDTVYTSSGVTMPICLNTIEGNPLYGKCIAKIVAGYDSNYVIDTTGTVWSWGNNNAGQLGNGTTAASNVPICINTKVKDLWTGYYQYSTGYSTVMAKDENGKLLTWGSGITIPSKVSGTTEYGTNEAYNKDFTSITASTATTSDGTVYKLQSLGVSYYLGVAEVENTTQVVSNRPTNVAQNITYTASNIASEIILDTNGKIWSYGYNGNGTLGDGTTTSRSSVDQYVCISDLTGNPLNGVTITEIKLYGVNGGTIIAKDSDGNIWTWGANYVWIGRTITDTENLLPSKVEFDEDVAIDKIVYGENSIYVIDENGALWSWGYNIYGILGNGTTAQSKTPVKVTTLGTAKVTDINITNYSVFVVDSNGTLWTWGQNVKNLLANGSTSSYISIPTAITAFGTTKVSKILKVSLSSYYYIFVKDENGALWSWGVNSYGLLGTGSTVDATAKTPVKISGLGSANINSLTALGDSTSAQTSMYAIDTDGKLWVWGYNTYGVLGTGSAVNKTSPVCLNTTYTALNSIQFTSVTLSNNVVTAKDTNGKLWAWGANSYGQLATGATSTVSGPVCWTDTFTSCGFQLDEFINIGNTMIARDTNGKIWAWGYNSSGQLGTGDTTSVTSPRCLSTELGFTVDTFYAISPSGYMIAKDTENNLWVWGYGITTPTKVLTDVKDKEGNLVLTNSGDVYMLRGTTATCLTDNEAQVVITGSWSEGFTVIKDTSYGM